MRCQYVKRIPEFVDNLLHLYRQETTDSDRELGMPWYPNAHRIVCEWSEHYNVSIATVACVIAAISPQCEWSRNLIIADEILAGMPALSIGGALNVNIIKARKILADHATTTVGYFKSGPKVASFSRNLAGDYSLVTVDTHATQAAMGDVHVTVSLKWNSYECFATAYDHAANKLGLEPAIFQAVIWHTWKRLYPRTVKLQERKQWHVVGEAD
jgi:hypothetical protein